MIYNIVPVRSYFRARCWAPRPGRVSSPSTGSGPTAGKRPVYGKQDLSNCRIGCRWCIPGCSGSIGTGSLLSVLFGLQGLAPLFFRPTSWIGLCFCRFWISRISVEWICSWILFYCQWIYCLCRNLVSHFVFGCDFCLKNYFHQRDWNQPNHHP